MSRFEQIKSRNKKRTEKHSDRVHVKPEARRGAEVIHETTSLVHAIDRCLARERRPSLTR